jgi:hypothetical protein
MFHFLCFISLGPYESVATHACILSAALRFFEFLCFPCLLLCLQLAWRFLASFSHRCMGLFHIVVSSLCLPRSLNLHLFDPLSKKKCLSGIRVGLAMMLWLNSCARPLRSREGSPLSCRSKAFRSWKSSADSSAALPRFLWSTLPTSLQTCNESSTEEGRELLNLLMLHAMTLQLCSPLNVYQGNIDSTGNKEANGQVPRYHVQPQHIFSTIPQHNVYTSYNIM